MNEVIELLRRVQGAVFESKDGYKQELRLLPPVTDHELTSLEVRIPCRLPGDVRELLRFSRGLSGPFEINFAGSDVSVFGLTEIFPCFIDLARDGCGNFWGVDLVSSSTTWAPVIYVCHDPAVMVFQADSLAHFASEVLRGLSSPWTSEVDEVYDRFSTRIWRQNPGVLTYAEAIASADPDLKSFALSLDESWEFIDLRNPKLGDGFSWGRYGPKTQLMRFGEKRIFACQKKSWPQRFLDAFR